VTKFAPEQVADVLAVQQLVNEWATELDVNNGLKIAELLTEDCRYNVGGEWRKGRAEAVKFYVERIPRLAATPGGVPVLRHVLCNPRVTFTSATEAGIAFGLVYFSTAALQMGLKAADPLAVADVSMTARKESDGHWRLSSFDSVQTLTRA
jgi:SnoaL-like domain